MRPGQNHDNKIAIFYHCAEMGSWKDVDTEIESKLRDSGLLERADVYVKNSCKDVGLYEMPTLGMLHHFATKNPDYSILYIHTKGVSREQTQQIKDWRKCMIYWNIERWTECIKKLKSYDAVGIDVWEYPIKHFRGNFWWATAKHIKKLGLPEEIESSDVIDDRHKAEFWVLNQSAKIYTPYSNFLGDNDNPYKQLNPTENYVNRNF